MWTVFTVGWTLLLDYYIFLRREDNDNELKKSTRG
jgi:hypothetical protein